MHVSEALMLMQILTWLIDRYMFEKISERSEGMFPLYAIKDADTSSIFQSTRSNP